MPHITQCAFAGMSLAQIETSFAARQLTGMGYHHLKDHVDLCPLGCRPLAASERPPMERYRREPDRPSPSSNATSSR